MPSIQQEDCADADADVDADAGLDASAWQGPWNSKAESRARAGESPGTNCPEEGRTLLSAPLEPPIIDDLVGISLFQLQT